MQQKQLFIESAYVAFDDVVRGSGGYKKVAGQLWPDMSMDSAYARMKACLCPDKAEKFGLETIGWLLELGRTNGIDVAATWFMREAGYKDPVPDTPKSPKYLLLEQQSAMAVEQARLQKEIDRIDHADLLKAVK